MGERGSLDQRSFRAGLGVGVRAAMVILERGRLHIHVNHYLDMKAQLQDLVDRAEGRSVSSIADGEAEIASWTPTPGEIEIASWTRPEGAP